MPPDSPVFKTGTDDAKEFLKAEPGGRFNLSTQEFPSPRCVDSAQPDAASQAYRKVLYECWRNYHKNGLKGIATYSRGNGKEANPGGVLWTVT